MGSRLPVGRVTLPYVDESSNLKINDAVSFVAEQAYAPFSDIAVGTNASQLITAANAVQLSGISINLFTPVPANVTAHVTVRVNCSVFNAGSEFHVGLFRDASLIGATTSVWKCSTVDEAAMVSFSYLQKDILPQTKYTYSVRAWIGGGLGATYRCVGTSSNLILATEARQRDY